MPRDTTNQGQLGRNSVPKLQLVAENKSIDPGVAIRDGVPDGPYDIVMCRNLAFTYFDEWLQADIALKIHEALRPDGVLVTGAHERLPAGLPFVSEPGGRYFHWRSARA